MTFRATEDGLLYRVEQTGVDKRILEGPHAQVGAGQLAGTGFLSARGAIREQGAILFAGSGLLVAGVTLVGVQPGAAALAGAGSLAVALTVLARASAAFTGVGALAVPLRTAEVAAAVLAGTGDLSVTGARLTPAGTVFAGDGILTAGTTIRTYGALAWPGVGSLAAGVSVLGGGDTIALAGAGALSVAPYRLTPAVASFAGAGALTVAPRLRVPAAAAFAGTGLLSGDLPVRVPVATTLAGVGALTAVVRLGAAALAELAGDSDLTAGLTQTHLVAGPIILAGEGELLSGVPPFVTARTALAGIGALTVLIAPPYRRAAASFAGVGALVTNVVRVPPILGAGLVGVGALVGRAAHTVYILPTRTNFVRNNTNVGAIAGVGGTLPDYWSHPNPFTGLTRTITLAMSPEGYPITRFRFQGTVIGGASNVRATEDEFYLRVDQTGASERVLEGPQGVGALGGAIAFEQPNSIPAYDGETWAHSLKLALVAGSTSNIDSVQLELWALGPTGSLLTMLDALNVMPSLTSDSRRFSQVVTIPAGLDIGFIRPVLKFNFYDGDVDFTVDVAGAQVERNVVTDIIKTAGTAVSIGPDLWYRGAGSLNVAAVSRVRAMVGLAGQGALLGQPSLPLPTRAALSGTGQLSAETTRLLAARVGFAGTGTLVTEARYALPGRAAFAGAGALVVDRTTYREAIRAAFAGQGTLRSGILQLATTQLAGVGSLSTLAVRAFPIRAVLAGAGALRFPAGVAYPTAATLAGAGLLAGPLAVRQPVAAAFDGAGQLRAPIAVGRGAAAAFAGTGDLRVATVRRLAAGAWLTGQGDLSTRGRVRVRTAAHLVGDGLLTATVGQDRKPISAWLRGAGLLTGYQRVSPGLGARLEGHGALEAWIGRVGLNRVWLRGAGQLAGPLAETQLFRARFQGAGRMITRVERGPQYGTGLLAGTGKLTVRVREILPTRAVFHGQGFLNAGTVHGFETLLDGRGALVAAPPVYRVPIRVTLAGAGALRVEARPDMFRGAARLVGQGTLTVKVRGDPAISASLRGTGRLHWQPAEINLSGFRFYGDGRLVTRAPRFRPILSEMHGTGRLWADPMVLEWIYEPPLILYPPFRVRLLRATTKVA